MRAVRNPVRPRLFTESAENTLLPSHRVAYMDCSSHSHRRAAGGGGGSSSGNSKLIKFLKRTLSFSDGGAGDIPKGYLAVCVGEAMQRFVIPTEYLGHRAFGVLLREAEEEFGFEQEGVLRIPCEVAVFERILKMLQN